MNPGMKTALTWIVVIALLAAGTAGFFYKPAPTVIKSDNQTTTIYRHSYAECLTFLLQFPQTSEEVAKRFRIPADQAYRIFMGSNYDCTSKTFFLKNIYNGFGLTVDGPELIPLTIEVPRGGQIYANYGDLVQGEYYHEQSIARVVKGNVTGRKMSVMADIWQFDTERTAGAPCVTGPEPIRLVHPFFTGRPC